MSPRAKKDPSVVAAYTRVSRVGGRAGEGFISFDDQEDGIRRRARELGLTVPDDAWFREPDASGGSFKNRPQWDAMMARIDDPDDPLAGFIAVRTDRFSRNVAEGASVAEQLRRAGRNFVLVDIPVDFSTPEGELMFNQMLAYAQYQLSSLKAGWWRTKKHAIDRGAHIGRTPVGFTRIRSDAPVDSGKLVPREEWRAPVNRLFEHAEENPHLGDGALAAWANEHNPRPDDRRWYPGMVARMLANPAYIGRVAYRPREGHDVVWPYEALENPAAHEGLVDEGLFLRVQGRRLSRRTAQQLDTQRPKQGREPALLQGLLRCAGCQHLLKPSMAGRGVLVYHCDGGKHRASGVCPSPVTIARHLIETYVVSQVRAADEILRARLVSREASDEELRTAERALAEAREELELISANTSMAARQPRRWETMIAHAERGVRDAQVAYDSALAARPVLAPLPSDVEWDDLTVAERRTLIAGAIDCAFVRSGRGLPPARRTLILWKGQAADHDLDLPGKGRPAKAPPVPLDWEDPVSGVPIA